MGKHKSINNNIMEKIKLHIIENINLYIIVAIFFMIGVIAGVLLLNNLNERAQEPIDNYIINFIHKIKEGYKIDHNSLLRQTIVSHVSFTILIWFMGGTVIGLPIVYGLISLKGFSLSYTIASIIVNLGTSRGIIFCILSLFLQNIIAIPAFLALGVSGNRLYKSIIKDKRKENIKVEIIRHTLFSFLMLVVLVISALIESYISSGLTEFYISTIDI